MKAMCFIMLAAPCLQLFAQQESTEDLTHKVDSLMKSYQFNKALTLLNARGDSLALETLQYKGYCYHQLGNYNEAIDAYTNILKSDPLNRRAWLALGQLYGRMKQYGESFNAYRKLIEMDSLNSYYYKQYAFVALEADAQDAAIASLQKALELNPTDIESTTKLAELLVDGEQPEMAEEILTNVLTRTSSPHLRLLLAKAQMDGKKYKEAIQTTTELMTNDTLPAHARILGASHYKLGHSEEAIPWLKFMLEAGFKGEWIYYYIGAAYQELNKQDSAIVYFNKAVKKGTSQYMNSYFVQLATSYEAKSNFKMAIKYYKAAYRESRVGILLYHLACTYDVYYKDKAPALAYFKRYLESDDTIQAAREYSQHRVDQLMN